MKKSNYWEDLSERWKQYFIQSLKNTESLSKDKETQVGALIIDVPKKQIISSGYNGLPRKVLDLDYRLTRPSKYMYTIHAEVNCLITALKNGTNVEGMTLISSLAPCCNCSAIIVNSGISEVVCPNFDMSHISCGDGYKASIAMFNEAGIKISIIDI